MATVQRYNSRIIPQATGTPGMDRSGEILAGGVRDFAQGLLSVGVSRQNARQKAMEKQAAEAKKSEESWQKLMDDTAFAAYSVALTSENEKRKNTAQSEAEYISGLAEVEGRILSSEDITPGAKAQLVPFVGQIFRSGVSEVTARLAKQAADKAAANIDATLEGMGQLAQKMDNPALISAYYLSSETSRKVREVLGPKADKVLSDSRNASYLISGHRKIQEGDPSAAIALYSDAKNLPKDFPEGVRLTLLELARTEAPRFAQRLQVDATSTTRDLTLTVNSYIATGKPSEALSLLYSQRGAAQAELDQANAARNPARAAAAQKKLASISAMETYAVSAAGDAVDKSEVVEQINVKLNELSDIGGKLTKNAEAQKYVELLDFLHDKMIRREITPGKYDWYAEKLRVTAAQSANKLAGKYAYTFSFLASEYQKTPEAEGSRYLTASLNSIVPAAGELLRGSVRLDYLNRVMAYEQNGRKMDGETARTFARQAIYDKFNIPESADGTFHYNGTDFRVAKDGTILRGNK